MNPLNFDWYAPKNAHRHTVEEVRDWCECLSLTIEHEFVQEFRHIDHRPQAGCLKPRGDTVGIIICAELLAT